jgi:RNase adaptor protein for sRNA GlmZ degradation
MNPDRRKPVGVLVFLGKERLENMQTHKLLILTGASGAGKTAIVKSLQQPAAAAGIELLNFDSIGVPSNEEMIRDFGSGENWQRTKIVEWIQRIAQALPERCIIFEGQMRISSLLEALKQVNIPEAKILLIDCSDSARSHRLNVLRQQPGLNNERMRTWAGYLRREALSENIQIVDTSNLSAEEAADLVLKIVDLVSNRTGETPLRGSSICR